MNRLQSLDGKEKEAIRRIAHPAIGEIYCINEGAARATLHEIFVDKLYSQGGVSFYPAISSLMLEPILGYLRSSLRSKERRSMRLSRSRPPSKCFSTTYTYTA